MAASGEKAQPYSEGAERLEDGVKKQKAQPYSEVVERLEDVVKKLETGQLSLEDTLAEFEKGIRLVQRGEELLAQADKRVQELLEHQGQDRAVPLETKETSKGQGRTPASPGEDEDIPF